MKQKLFLTCNTTFRTKNFNLLSRKDFSNSSFPFFVKMHLLLKTSIRNVTLGTSYRVIKEMQQHNSLPKYKVFARKDQSNLDWFKVLLELYPLKNTKYLFVLAEMRAVCKTEWESLSNYIVSLFLKQSKLCYNQQ